MPNSLERFTAEQFSLLRQEIRAAYTREPEREGEVTKLILNVLGEKTQAMGLSLMFQLQREGHMVCCASTAMSLFVTGFIHGWKGREMLMDIDDLEKTLGPETVDSKQQTVIPREDARIMDELNRVRAADGLPPLEFK